MHVSPAPRRWRRSTDGARASRGLVVPQGSRRTWSWVTVASFVAWGLVAVFLGHWSLTRAIDLQVYRDAARDMLSGGATYVRSFTVHGLPFTYPPFALLVLAPLSYGSATTVVWVWGAASGLALVVALTAVVRHAVSLSWPKTLAVAAAVAGVSCLALEPVRSTLLDGQINLFLLAAVVLDLLVVRPPFRGILVGLAAAVKLTPLIFLVYFVASGDRRSAMRAGGAFLAATGLAWVVLPKDSSMFWLHQAFSPGHKGGTRTSFNQSWWGLVGRLPATDGAVRTAAWLALCAATLCVGAFLARRLARTGRTLEAILVVAVAGLLVSPVSWTHHWSWLVLAPVVLVAGQPRPRVVTWALGIVLVVAAISPYGWHLHGPGAVLASFSLVLCGAALLATMAAVEWRRGPARTHSSAARAPEPAAAP